MKYYSRMAVMVSIALLSACSSLNLKNPGWLDFTFGKYMRKKPAVAKLQPASREVTRQQGLAHFNNIKAEGAFHIKLIQDPKHRDLRISGHTDLVPYLQAVVNDGTLYLHFSEQFLEKDIKHVELLIRTPNVHHITYAGRGSITTEGFKTALLDLNVKDGKVNLNGRLGLRNLTARGESEVVIAGLDSRTLHVKMQDKARISLRGVTGIRSIEGTGAAVLQAQWVDSKNIKVRLDDHAKAMLAGVAGTLNAHVRDDALLDAKYLRAKNAYVKTYNNALAELTVIDSQNTLADGESNIYFYKDAKFHGDFMANEGSVLDMQGLWRVQKKPEALPTKQIS